MASKNGALKRLAMQGLALYKMAWTDSQIAAKLKCSKSQVCMWRAKLKLKPNAPSGSSDWNMYRKTNMEKASRMLQAWEAGLTDRQGAELLGITTSAYQKRRRRMGLPPLCPTPRDAQAEYQNDE